MRRGRERMVGNAVAAEVRAAMMVVVNHSRGRRGDNTREGYCMQDCRLMQVPTLPAHILRDLFVAA